MDKITRIVVTLEDGTTRTFDGAGAVSASTALERPQGGGPYAEVGVQVVASMRVEMEG